MDVIDSTPYDLLIGDSWRAGTEGRTFDTYNPATARVLASVHEASEADVDAAVQAAHGAYETHWRKTTPAQRGKLLRRLAEPEELLPTTLEAGPVRMDVERHVVTVRGGQLPFPLKEFELLEMLLRNAGRVLTRGQLIDRVWGSDYVGDTKTLDVHIKRLRAKVEADPANPVHILTVRGLGYKFEV